MTDTCNVEPISHLRLEHYLLGEVHEAEQRRIEDHLGQCRACRAAFDELSASLIELPPLPMPLRTQLRPPRWLWGAGASLLAAACVLLMMRAAPSSTALPESRQTIKGGELAIDVIREHAGDTALDPHFWQAGDRLAVAVTCPPELAPHWEFVVFQAAQAFFPLQPTAALTCGNHVVLPGAFRLTGADEATVCVALDEQAPIDRKHLRTAADLPKLSACTTLRPVSNGE